MGQCEESLIAGSHNQVRFPLPGTLANAAHDETFGSERPVIGIQDDMAEALDEEWKEGFDVSEES